MNLEFLNYSSGRNKSKLWRKVIVVATLSLILVLLAGLFTACPNSDSSESSPPDSGTSAFPLTITDQAGRTVTIESEPQKIVSLAPSNTEILYALGLDDRLVGVTTYCDYPLAAKDKPKIGGFTTVDIEALIAIQPDLILASVVHTSEVVPVLEAFGLTVIVLQPRTLDEVMETITLIGRSAGKEDEAAQLVANMETRIKAVTDKTANLTEAQRPRVFYLRVVDPLQTIGSNTLIHELIEKAGGINIGQYIGEGWLYVSLEAVIVTNPEVIICDIGHGTQTGGNIQWATTDERLAGMDARINDRIYAIITDYVSRPGPRIVDGLEMLAKMIQPEIFG